MAHHDVPIARRLVQRSVTGIVCSVNVEFRCRAVQQHPFSAEHGTPGTFGVMKSAGVSCGGLPEEAEDHVCLSRFSHRAQEALIVFVQLHGGDAVNFINPGNLQSSASAK
jgi:hypothetical protein